VSASERSEEPCELPGLAQRPFAVRALRSKAVARGGNPERRGPTMALVVFSFARVNCVWNLLRSAIWQSLHLGAYSGHISNVLH
jgi:hypothetical protein